MSGKEIMQARVDVPEPSIDEADADNFISLEHLRRGLTMRLPAFSSKPGSRVRLDISGATHRLEVHVAIEDPASDIVALVAAEDSIQFASGERVSLQAFYFEAGNPAELSPAVYFATGAEVYRPTVDEAVGGDIPGTYATIPESATNVTVRIRPFENMAAGNRIQLYLLGNAPSGSARLTLEVKPEDVGKDITFVANISAHRKNALYIYYEVDQGGRTLTPSHSPFYVQELVRVRFLGYEDFSVPDKRLSIKPDGPGCVSVFVTIPDGTRESDRITFFALPPYGPAIIVSQVFESTPAKEVRLCVPYDRLAKYVGNDMQMGCIVESMSGNGATVSSRIEGGRIVE